MSSSVSDNNSYPNFCQKAATDDNIFETFKRNLVYTEILEHVSKEEGLRYINHFCSNKLITDNAEKFKINDTLGTPKINTFDIGNFSPTTLRYMSVLSDLSQLNLNDKNITEIGAGYGGQYCIIRQVYTPKSYTFIDLPEVLLLIKKYVTTLKLDDIELNFVDANVVGQITSDLVISNYAYSECTEEIQDMYMSNVINNSNHGYIIHNNMHGYKHTEFVSQCNKKVKVLPETPSTNPTAVLLTW
jgi:hypothetical protein